MFVSLAIRRARISGCGRWTCDCARRRSCGFTSRAGVGSWQRRGSGRLCGQSRVSFGGEECKESVLSHFLPLGEPVPFFSFHALFVSSPFLSLDSSSFAAVILSYSIPIPFLSFRFDSPLLSWMDGRVGGMWDLEMEQRDRQIPADFREAARSSPFGYSPLSHLSWIYPLVSLSFSTSQLKDYITVFWSRPCVVGSAL